MSRFVGRCAFVSPLMVGLLALACTAFGAELVQPGSPMFKPSPKQPVGWRGDGTGHFPAATPPLHWERKHEGDRYTAEGIAWAAPLPNKGVSSPILVGDRLYLTAEGSDLVCINKADGRLLWIHSNLESDTLDDEDLKANPEIEQTIWPLTKKLEEANATVVADLNQLLPTATTSPNTAPKSLIAKRELEKKIETELNKLDKKKFDHSWPQGVYGYCTETPTSDGQRVYAYFGSGVAACYDASGKRLWIAHSPAGGEEKGNYTSPLLMDGKLIVWGGKQLRAYDAATGKVAWTQRVDGANASSLYGLRVGSDGVVGFRNFFVRVSDGSVLWGSKQVDNSTLTPIVDGGTIFTGFGVPAAMRALSVPSDLEGGKIAPAITFKTEFGGDDLPKSKARPFDREFMASPLLVDGLLYRVCCGGGLLVNDATSGEILYSKVLPMKPRTEYWAWGGAAVSPSLAGKHIFLMDNQGTTVIIEPGREYKQVAVNRIEEVDQGNKEQPQNLANPVFEGKRIYYRTPGYLYCIGDK